MNTSLAAGLFFGFLITVVWVGRSVRRHLPEHHLSADSKDAVKLAMGLVATMTALLLGLLISSAKGSYDTQRSEVIQMAAKVTFLNRVLVLYGPETTEARAKFHDTVAEANRRMWPEEAGTPAPLRAAGQGGDELFVLIQRLAPRDDLQRSLKTMATATAADIGQLLALLLAQSVSSISQPLLLAVVSWLAILFLSFSLIAPPNAMTGLALGAAAFSVALAIFLILELDHPLGGLIRISSEPMRNALNLLGK